MAEWLIIRFADGGSTPSFMVADGAGRQIEAPRTGTLAEARQRMAGRRICALVPASDVLLAEADIPARTTNARLQQILPFALEEQLAEDVDSLHFAPGRRGPGATRIPVAVVARSLLDHWLGALREAGLEPEALYADSSLLPANPGQAIALLEQDSILLRPAGAQGVTLPLAALSEALELLQPRTDAATVDLPAGMTAGAGHGLVPAAASRGLVVFAESAQWQRYQAQFEAVRDRFEQLSVQLLSDGALPLLAQSLGSPAAINLLQGTYAPAGSTQGNWRAWRTAAALLGGLLVLHGVGAAAQLLMLKKSEHKLDAAITQTAQAVMPGVADTGNARRIMESRLRVAQGADESTGLLAVLSAVSQARTASPGTSVQSLSFHDGSLEMQVNGPGADALDHIGQQLRAGGWQADLTSTTAAGSSYQGRILVKRRS